jgi:FkbM family methyltransferase
MLNTAIIRTLRVLRTLPYFRGRDRAHDALASLLTGDASVVIDGIDLLLDTGETSHLGMLTTGHLEPLTVRAIRRILRPGDAYIDVGAHAGVLATTAAAAVGSTGMVIAIDPQPANCDRVLTNAARNALCNIVVLTAAAGAREDWARLHMQQPSDRSRLSLAEREPDATPYTFCVPIVRLDSILTRFGLSGARLIKLDVEGYELEVLRGCGDRLADIDACVVELLPGSSHTEIFALLSSFGFRFYDVTGRSMSDVSSLPEHNLLAMRSDLLNQP